jgi:hypothetical protein
MELSLMSTKLDAGAVRRSLLKHAGHLPATDHETIIGGMHRDGLLDGATLYAAAGNAQAPVEFARVVMTAAQVFAADPRNKPLLTQAIAACHRLGYDVPSDEPCDLRAIDRAFAGKDPDARMRAKAMLAQLHLIP